MEELDLELQEQRVVRRAKEKRAKEVEASRQREEVEMKRIAEAERKREFVRRADRSRCEKVFFSPCLPVRLQKRMLLKSVTITRMCPAADGSSSDDGFATAGYEGGAA